MNIPTWSPFVAGIAAYFSYWLGHYRGERIAKRTPRFLTSTPPPQRAAYDITINFAGKPEDMPGFEERMRETLKKAAKGKPASKWDDPDVCARGTRDASGNVTQSKGPTS